MKRIGSTLLVTWRLQQGMVTCTRQRLNIRRYIAYLGPFTALYRSEILQNWIAKAQELKINIDTGFTLEKCLGDPVMIREWTGPMGLPADRLSVENAILVKRGRRWPLMIDPQTQVTIQGEIIILTA